LKHDFIPGTLNLETPDAQLQSHIISANQERPIERVLTNSFGFGGNNCSLVLGLAA
jgi:3-oxoacyl-[acyl-carrier-protein] synthase-1